jgi:ATP-binding cassette, subfamily G (WHITE), member 2, SNQ2
MDVSCLCTSRSQLLLYEYSQEIAFFLQPFTYLIEGLLGQGRYPFFCGSDSDCSRFRFSAIGHQNIVCAPKELATLNPPSGTTCGAFMQQYISERGGYLVNPEASSQCSFCSMGTTDQFMAASFNIFYKHHWRNAGLFVAYIVFNVGIPSCVRLATPLMLYG